MKKTQRLVLAENVKRLMGFYDEMSEPALARKAVVDQKTINNLLNPERQIEPQLDTIEKVAKALKTQIYKLFISEIPLDLLVDDKLSRLYESFTNANEEGRAEILRVAEREVKYARAGGPKMSN